MHPFPSFPRPLRRIITHPGRAHRDDAYACGVLLALNAESQLQCCSPTAEELDDLETAVVDIGGRHEPERANFDHHQFPADSLEAPCCALTLVLRALGCEPLARVLWPWLEPLEWQDTRGPAATVQHFTPGVDFTEGIARTASPADAWLLARCEAGDAEFVRAFGRHLLAELEGARAAFAALDNAACWQTVHSLDILDIRAVGAPRALSPAFQNAWLAMKERAPAIIIGHSQRAADCVNLVRHLDHPAVDFRRFNGEPEVSFIHANGFLACVRSCPEPRLRELIAAAIVVEKISAEVQVQACRLPAEPDMV